ncbi:MAG: general stress protein [Vulcanimicrobiaceae bacterium]
MKNNFETGIYYDRASAETTVQRLRDLGYSDKDISVMMKDKEHARAFAEDTGSHAAEGAVTGGAIGGGLGAIVAGLMATGSVAAIVGTGGVATPLVVGPLAAALAGLGAGAATGGIVGALIGAGIPKEKAAEYEEGLNRGGILLGVNPRDEDRDRVRVIFTSPTKRHAGKGDIDSRELTSTRS